MSNANGEVVSFDSTAVYLAAGGPGASASKEKRQTTQAQPAANAAAMSNANGDVVSFDSTAVYLAAGGPGASA